MNTNMEGVMMRIRNLAGVIVVAVLTLSGCGGGGGGGAAVPTTTVVSGVAAKGPIKTGTVKVYAIVNGIEDRSAPLGQGQTDGNGNYSVDVGSYTGPILMEVSGGSYTDEVSGAAVTLKAPLRAIISAAATGSQTVAITPLTELAYKKASGNGLLTAASIDDANATIAAFFNLTDIIKSSPIAGSSDDNQKKYAFVLGSFAQLANDGKNAGESLDDAQARLITQIGDEIKASGGISTSTLTQLNSAISAFAAGGRNQTGSSITPIAAPTSGLLKLSTAGTPNTIGAIDLVINLPAGVLINYDQATGEAAADVVTVSGVAATGSNQLSLAKFTPAAGAVPAQLHVVLVNAAGFGLGEFVTIRFDLGAGVSSPASAGEFTIASFSPKALSGTTLTGITASAASIGLALN